MECGHDLSNVFLDEFTCNEATAEKNVYENENTIFVLKHKSRLSNIYLKKFFARHTFSTFCAIHTALTIASTAAFLAAPPPFQKKTQYFLSCEVKHAASVAYWFKCHFAGAAGVWLLRLRYCNHTQFAKKYVSFISFFFRSFCAPANHKRAQ